MQYVNERAMEIINELRNPGQSLSGVIIQHMGPIAERVHEKKN
jgi:hypothetical protein